MPMIDLTLPKNVLKEDEAAALIGQLTDILPRWEGAEISNKAAQSIAWGVVNFADVLTVGAVPVAKPVYRLTITVPQHSLTDEIKVGVVQELT